MSLPQRKKSAEEIAKLRESLGIGGIAPADPALTESASPAVAESPVAEPPAAEPVIAAIHARPAIAEILPLPEASLSAPEVKESPPVRELQHPERAPVLAVELSGPPQEHPASDEPEPEPEGIPIPLPAPRAVKVVRSLRKSEQGPVVPSQRPAAKNSSLPVHRHSDEEIARIRRMEMAAKANLPPPPAPTAHLAVVIPGYLAALAGAACFIDDAQRQRLPIIVSCLVAALLIAAYIFVKKPYSRYHSGFIAVITLFIIIFGALYYFPQLRHGT